MATASAVKVERKTGRLARFLFDALDDAISYKPTEDPLTI